MLQAITGQEAGVAIQGNLKNSHLNVFIHSSGENDSGFRKGFRSEKYHSDDNFQRKRSNFRGFNNRGRGDFRGGRGSRNDYRHRGSFNSSKNSQIFLYFDFRRRLQI